MKKAVLLSLLGLVAGHNAYADTGRIYLSSGERQVDMSYETPTTQAISDEDLQNVINSLTSKAQKSYVYDGASDSYSVSSDDNLFGEIHSDNYSQSSYSQNNYSQSSYAKSYANSSPKKLDSDAPPSIAAQVASRAAHNSSIGRCALYVRKALQAAGYKFTSQASAYMYATNGTLKSAGFTRIDSNNYKPQLGDVVVFNRTSKNPHGHIQIYDGNGWVSDFRQNKFSPYSQHNGYSVWRDSRYLDNASNSGIYLAYNDDK